MRVKGSSHPQICTQDVCVNILRPQNDHHDHDMYFVYILSNWDDAVIYVGVTSNLPRRLYEHKNGLADGFTKRYHVHKLVYYEHTNDVRSAIAREKQLKGWTRNKKNALISKMNPNWIDLSSTWE